MTILPPAEGGLLTNEMATLDHLYMKGDPRRPVKGERHEYVLSCFSCNKTRSALHSKKLNNNQNGINFFNQRDFTPQPKPKGRQEIQIKVKHPLPPPRHPIEIINDKIEQIEDELRYHLYSSDLDSITVSRIKILREQRNFLRQQDAKFVKYETDKKLNHPILQGGLKIIKEQLL